MDTENFTVRITKKEWCNWNYESREFMKVLVNGSAAAERSNKINTETWLLMFLEPCQ